ncbi:MAG: DNA polymerase III subunit alpha [Defluviitaleaceae bacterium]|nr:DNA polymerase III subunit alpha [Defluviitaleaceae bacterium]
MDQFTHLHVHSEYSLLDGSARIGELISRAKAFGMASIAITDHGVMYGVIEFYKQALKNGVKPIIGCEVYVAPDSRFNKEKGFGGAFTHLVLLAENNEGYHNLIRLVSIGFTEGFYYKPRVDVETLRKFSKGLIALSACASGAVSRAILNVSYKSALEQALLYDGIFGRGNYFLELQDHGLADQQTINPGLIKIHNETGIPMVCTNDVHYISREDAKAHEILLCIQTGKTVMDDDRMKYEGDQFYLKTSEEMRNLFPYAKEALDNTGMVAERCGVDIVFKEYKLPKFDISDEYKKDLKSKAAGETASAFLRHLCEEGLVFRYGESAALHTARLDYEIGTIIGMGFVDYFLIVWDFIKFARDNSVMVGPGRGSGAGSIVAYCLRITDVDPIRYDLPFERFMHSERVSMPDFDIDFCYERRQEVIDYVIEKYGADHVSQIITFGTMAARAATRDVGRALAMAYADVDRVAKMIPLMLEMTIEKALGMNPDLKKAYDEEDDTRELLDMSMRLEGLPRHASTHAAGVVICDKPVSEYIPLNINDGVVTTQFPKDTVEELGLLKMDFLGLRTLTVIRKALDEIERGHGRHVDFDQMEYDDPNVYEIISQAKTEGVFQLESPGMKSLMKELRCNRLEEIMAGIALFRPGPMNSIPKYVAGRNDPKKIAYTHPKLVPILEDSYGCIVYQEHVMQIVRDLAGYSMSRSDLVRRAMSKKISQVMDEERRNFIYGCENVPGCIKNGIPEHTAARIYDDMITFAQYGFNKAHAAAYAFISYQTAWLKVYYPVEFMAATLSSVMDFTEKVSEYIQECRKIGIKLLPPDINEGFGYFSVSEKNIRFSLSAIKNVGRGTVDAIVAEREANGKFRGMTDFIKRMDAGEINKRCVESLIKAGAFDSLGGRRSQYMSLYRAVMNGMSQSKRKTIDGQMNLFELDGQEAAYSVDDLPDIDEFATRLLLNDEKEVLGVYVSGHPLSAHEAVLKQYANTDSLFFRHNPDKNSGDSAPADGQVVKYGGMITDKTIKYTKTTNKPMAFLIIEDLYGPVETVVFSNLYEKYGPKLHKDQVLIVQGRVSVKEDEDAKLVANELMLYEDLPAAAAKTLWIKIPVAQPVELQSVTDILRSYRGETRVMVYNEKMNQRFLANEAFWVHPCKSLMDELESLLGDGSVKMVNAKEAS